MGSHERTDSEFYNVVGRDLTGNACTVKNIPYNIRNFNVELRVKFLIDSYMPLEGIYEYNFLKWDDHAEKSFKTWLFYVGLRKHEEEIING